MNLASRALGASVVAANDESFGEKENLVVDAPSNFVPGTYGHKGEIVDGWETRRRGEPGEDWAIVRLGAAGVIREVDIDTTAFSGNFPERAKLEACGVEGYPSPADLADAAWETVLDWQDLAGDKHNVFPVASDRRWTHVRLGISTDGGVARLRVHGDVVPDPADVDGLTVDLAGRAYGGELVSASDGFYSDPAALNHPHAARNMGEGWETRRRRGPGHDHVVLRLAAPGRIRVVEVDTTYYVHNASKYMEIHTVAGGDDWHELVPRTGLQPDTRHRFPVAAEGVTHVRMDVFPDGGVSRLRVFGEITGTARAALGRAWFDALPSAQAIVVLAQRCGVRDEEAMALVAARPVDDAALAAAPEAVRTLILGGTNS